MNSATIPSLATQLRLALGAESFDPGLRLLAGENRETHFATAQPAESSGVFRLFKQPDWLIGAVNLSLDSPGNLEELTRQVYNDVLRASRGWNLARIWNYVPDINGTGPDGLEHYRAFCRGRSLAFEQAMGATFHQFLPAASAVGCTGHKLTVVFAATTLATRHAENPLQVPAYHYPQNYGPRAPSFARATTVPRAGQADAVFISGTAAIRGHETVAPASTLAQLDCTLENLREISRVCGLGAELAANKRTRHFKVYLRHASDLPAVAAVLGEKLIRSGDAVSYVQADICRAQLNVEIEATLL